MYGSRFRLIPVLGIIAIIILLISIVFADMRVKSSLITLAKAEVQVTGAELINRIVNDKLVDNTNYEDLVSVHKDNQGRIVLIQPNTIMLNKIMTGTVMEVANSLGQMQDTIIEIPLGQLFGSDLLAACGPRLKVRTIPAGQVHVNVLNKFEQAGINQTRHLIYFEVRSNITVAVPFMEEEVEILTVIPLTETIIVGDVPETYVNFRGEAEMLYPLMKGN